MKKQKQNKKRKINKKELEELERIIKPDEGVTFERILKLQHDSKQYFIRFPKDFEEILELEKGKNVNLIISIPPKHKDKKIKVQIKFIK